MFLQLFEKNGFNLLRVSEKRDAKKKN